MDLVHNTTVVSAIDAVATLVDATPVNGAWVALGDNETNMFAVEVTGVDTASYALSVEVADDISGTNAVAPTFTMGDDQASFTAVTGALTQVLKTEFEHQSDKPFARVTLTPTGGAGSSRDGYMLGGTLGRSL